jgi:hypothetical protein
MRISETVRTATDQDGSVIMDISQGQMFSANTIGSRIWQQLNEERSSEEIAEGFVTEFDIPREQALKDVNEFIQQLEARKLIRLSESLHFRDNPGVKEKGLFRGFFRWCNLGRQRTISGSEAIGNTHSQ